MRDYMESDVTMPEIGIRQLKNETSEILRAVREDKVEYVITYRGQPIALLRPVESAGEDPDTILSLAASVFAELNDEDLAAVEAAIRRRPDFSGDHVDAKT